VEEVKMGRTVSDEEVFQRDKFRCVYCDFDGSAFAGWVFLQVDHFKPKSFGGSDELDNLKTACVSCNTMKGAITFPTVEEARQAVAQWRMQMHQYWESRVKRFIPPILSDRMNDTEILLYRSTLSKRLIEQSRVLLPEHNFMHLADMVSCNIEFSSNSPYYFQLICNHPCQPGWYGVHRKVYLPNARNDVPELTAALNRLAPGEGREYRWYVWWRRPSETDPVLQTPGDWEKNDSAWREIESGELARKIVDAFKKVHSVLKEYGAG
jgi:hypothetical protein